MRILLIEDTESEIEAAKVTLAENHCKYVIAKTLEEASFALTTATFDGVLTDLHFPEEEKSGERSPPCGLAVLAICAENSTPVVVVSDIDHHFAEYAKVVVEVLAKLHPKGSIPFVMDKKDWAKGFQLLKELS